MVTTEPTSTGIGGDMFCLFYDAKSKKILALNGSGRSEQKCSLDVIRNSLGLRLDDGRPAKIGLESVHAVSVPGAAAGWCNTVEKFGSGKLSLKEILRSVIDLGEQGFPVSELVSFYWNKAEQDVRKASPSFRKMLDTDPNVPDGCRALRPGEIMKNPTLAAIFRTLANEGKMGFYTGNIAEEIVNVVQSLGGHLELEDLKHHLDLWSESVEPISLKSRGQGVADVLRGNAAGYNDAVEDLNGVNLGILPAASTPYLHTIIESLQIAFADASWWLTDPGVVKVPSAELISKRYLAERAKLFDVCRASRDTLVHGSPALPSSDTVYFAVSDAEGNAISFINSNYAGFGILIIPRGCGFTLQNRAANFSLDKNHPNVIAARKRPYHTIIPAAVTNIHDGSLHSIYGVMGGFMQPQGHVQVLLDQIVGRLNAQQALDAPRICIEAATSVRYGST